MGNRVYFTIKDKKGLSKSYYQHWNGGLDTFCPILDQAFKNDVSTVEPIVEFLESQGFKPEYQEDLSPWQCEENGHYYIDLKDKSFFQRYEDRVEFNGKVFYETRVRPLNSNLKEAFEEYILKNIKLEYHESVRLEYWKQLSELSGKYFKELNPLKNSETLSEVQQFIKESPYGMTAKEKNFIKRKLKALNTEDYTIKASFSGRVYQVSVVFKSEEKRNILGKEIKEKCEDIVNQHQVTYSERDPYTDFPGQYRLQYIYFKTETEGN